MRFIQVLRKVIIVLLVLGLGSLSRGAEKDKKTPDKNKPQGTVHTVDASVGYPTNAGVGIQAEKRPGEFTIPKGSKGTRLKYGFADPKTDYTSTKLRGSNIYSVTEKRYMHELDHNPDFELPPGEYKFVVGGQPGASGTLVYTTVPDLNAGQPPGDSPTRKPPTGTPGKDTAKPGTQTDTPHPGGEGPKPFPKSLRKRVIMRSTSTYVHSLHGEFKSSGAGEAPLTIDGDKFTIEFDVKKPDAPGSTAVWKWEGTVTRTAGAVTCSGKVLYSSTWSDVLGGQGFTRRNGTFSGTWDGKTLSGTSTERGETKGTRSAIAQEQISQEWSITGITP